MPIPEEGRAASHVLLDAASSWDDDATVEQNMASANLAVERLLELGVVRVDIEETDDDVNVGVDIADVIGPSTLLLHAALVLLEERGLDRAAAIVALREGVDRID